MRTNVDPEEMKAMSKDAKEQVGRLVQVWGASRVKGPISDARAASVSPLPFPAPRPALSVR